MQEAFTRPDDLFKDLAQQMQAYEIISAEDKRARYLFFAGDVGDVPGPGGMRVQSRCVPRKTLYRCMVTPCVTVRQMELTNLIPDGARVPGSEDRIKAGCSEYWVNAGPEANTLLSDYGNGGDTTKNWGLVELQPDLLRGLDWEKEVRPLQIQKIFFPEWPNLPESNTEVRAHLLDRIEAIRTATDEFVARNRDLYLAIGADMLRAVDSAQRHQEYICNQTNHGISQPRGDEAHKNRFDERDEVSFKRSGMIKNTDALRKVAEEMKNGSKNGLDEAALERVLSKIAPPQQVGFTPELLAQAIVIAKQMLAEESTDKTDKPKNAKSQREPVNDQTSTR